MSVDGILGKAESTIQIAAERLESGRKPKEVAAFLREALQEIETAYKAHYAKPERAA